MDKQKRDQIKKKIRKYAPAAATITAIAALGTVVVIQAVETANKIIDAQVNATLPEVTGDEKKRLLEHPNTILQKIEDNLYFLSIGTTDED